VYSVGDNSYSPSYDYSEFANTSGTTWQASIAMQIDVVGETQVYFMFYAKDLLNNKSSSSEYMLTSIQSSSCTLGP